MVIGPMCVLGVEGRFRKKGKVAKKFLVSLKKKMVEVMNHKVMYKEGSKA